MVDYKAIPLEVLELKADSDGWSFSAYASTFNTRDHGGDVILPGAFDRTLKSRSFRPLLWQHDMREPIGIEKSLVADRKGLLGTWEIIDTQRGADAYKLLKRGAIRSMSIGYIPGAFEFKDEGETRVLKDIDLLENSVVSIPMNDGAQVQSVKARFCSQCGTDLEAKAHETAHEFELAKLTFSELVDHFAEVAEAFGTGAKNLLATLAAEDHALNDSKRQELETLLGTFPGLDAVRTDVQHLLQTTTEDASPRAASALATRLKLARYRLRAAGVDV